MAKNITTWQPDTCGCVLHYEWDDSVPAEEIVLTPIEKFTDSSGNVRTPVVCEIHAALPAADGVATLGAVLKDDVQTHFDTVLAENQSKNFTIGALLENSIDSHYEELNEEGDTIRKWKKGYEPKWSFDENRNLAIEISPLTDPQEKATLIAQVETNFTDVAVK